MRTDAASAEWLNDFWDRLVDDPSLDARTMGADAGDLQLEALVHYLESLKPRTHQSQLASLRDRVGPFVTEETLMTTVASHSGHVPALDQPSVTPVRARLVPVGKAMNQLAGIALLLLIFAVAVLVVLASMRGVMDVDPARQLAALVGLDEDEPADQAPSSHSSMSIMVRPGDHEGGSMMVGLWQVTLPSGSAMSNGSTNFDIGFAVARGNVLLGGRGSELPIEEGGSASDLADLTYVRNPGDDSVELLVLVPMTVDADFPLTIEPWSPEGAATSAVANTPSPAAPVLLSSVELDDEDAFQYRVIIADNWMFPGVGLDDLERFGPPDSVLGAVTVLEGRLDVVPRGAVATPQAPVELITGDTLYPDEAGDWDVDVRVVGPNNARVLSLLTMPAAENRTLDQTVPSIAPFWGEWTVPASGEIDLRIRRLLIEPTGSYGLLTDVGVIYHVASGTVSVHNSETGSTMPVSTGGTVAQLPGTVLSFTNAGSEPAEMYQSIVSDAAQSFTDPQELQDLVAIETLVETTETLLPGSASLMMEVMEFNGTNDGGSSGDGPSLVLVTSMDGEITVRRDGGDVALVTSEGESPVTPNLGEGNQIGPGGYLVAQPGAGWAVTGGTGAPATGLVFSVSPNMGPWATPLATPMSTPVDTDAMIGRPENCDVEPMTVEQVNTLVATPSAVTSPLERSLRGDETGVTDAETTAEITAMLQAYTDCNATGDYPRIYAFYSDQAIRESEVMQDLVESDHDVGEMPHFTTTVEDIALFPDGRAGARTVIGHEAAYLTFVYEDGRWKIDVWDDSGS